MAKTRRQTLAPAEAARPPSPSGDELPAKEGMSFLRIAAGDEPTRRAPELGALGPGAAEAGGAGLVDEVARRMLAVLGGAGAAAPTPGRAAEEAPRARGRPSTAAAAAAALLEPRAPSNATDPDAGDDVQMPEELRWRPDLLLEARASRVGTNASASTSAAGASGPSAATADAAPAAPLSDPSALLAARRVPTLDGRALAKAARAAAPDTAGRSWFDMPAPELTEDVKRDLRLLRLRGAFDSRTFYKKDDATKFPKFFQFGTVQEGAAEWYSARLARADRAPTFAEEILRDSKLAGARASRYDKLQAERSRASPRPVSGRVKKGGQKKSRHRPKH